MKKYRIKQVGDKFYPQHDGIFFSQPFLKGSGMVKYRDSLEDALADIECWKRRGSAKSMEKTIIHNFE